MNTVSNLAVIRPARYGLPEAKKGYLLYWENGHHEHHSQSVDSWEIFPTVEAACAVALRKNPDTLVCVCFNTEGDAFVIVPEEFSGWHRPYEPRSEAL